MNARQSRDLHGKARYAMRPTMIQRIAMRAAANENTITGGAVSDFGIRLVDRGMR